VRSGSACFSIDVGGGRPLRAYKDTRGQQAVAGVRLRDGCGQPPMPFGGWEGRGLWTRGRARSRMSAFS
jgi:hypothetical protein